MMPESLKVLPLHILALLKSVIFRAGIDVHPDERSYYMMLARMLPIPLIIALTYPRLYSLHNMPDQAGVPTSGASVVLPPPCNLSSEKLDRTGVFLLENGLSMYLWIGKQVSSSFLADVFSVSSIEAVDTNQTTLPQLDNVLSIRINTIINAIRSSSSFPLQLNIVREGDPREIKFFSYFIEDRTKSVHSYYEFMVYLHQRIQSKLANS